MRNPIDFSADQIFTSGPGLMLSAPGIDVISGNILRFPGIAAENIVESRAGSFLIAWLIFMWIIVLLIVTIFNKGITSLFI